MMVLSICAYVGIILLIAAVVGAVRPIPRVWLKSRGRAVAVGGVGLLLLSVALLWPTPLMHVGASRSALDAQMPAYHFVEHHETRIAASPAAVLDAVRSVTTREIRFFSVLTWIRNPHVGRTEESILAAPPDKPILSVALGSDFDCSRSGRTASW